MARASGDPFYEGISDHQLILLSKFRELSRKRKDDVLKLLDLFYSERADSRDEREPALTQPIPTTVKRKELTMQDNPNTEHTDTQTHEIDLDREDWEVAFEPLEKNSFPVLKLGFNFAIMRKYLDSQLFKPRPVMEALDEAMQVLFAYTEFHDVSFNLFLKFSEGKLSFEEEQMLRALGVKF